jgi:CxxC motif-containing protein (DUF1111 family)
MRIPTKKISDLSYLVLLMSLFYACDEDQKTSAPLTVPDHIFALPGQPVPFATEAQLETFKKGEAIAKKQYRLTEGLGPLVNVTFCGACHEKPVFGGSAGLYRNFYLQGESLEDGSFSPLGPRSGVLDTFDYSGVPTKIQPPLEVNWLAMRNPIPFFGVGLVAEISEEEILANADPNDENQDGISGKPNYDRGYVGRFGMKSQTVSIENFIRGPLFNHLGLTSNPLPADMQATLPVPSVAQAIQDQMPKTEEIVTGLKIEQRSDHQAAAPSMPLKDDDAVMDPELPSQDLYDLVSWAMLLAAPKPSEMDANALAGKALFKEIGCEGCHIETLASPRGLIPLYSDLLLHDMGEQLADGIVMNMATGSEFRTQPLWGVVAEGPYLHDGRAHTLKSAILWHGGEAQKSKEKYEALSDVQKNQIESFLMSLGGKEIATAGLILPNTEVPKVGQAGGPLETLSDEKQSLWQTGRIFFDAEKGLEEGIGPHFNGDSCRACHFEPIIGGAGPIGVSAVRWGSIAENGDVNPPENEPVMRRFNLINEWPPFLREEPHFEIRQSLPLFGLQWIEDIPESSILSHEDPQDLDGNGIKGVANRLADGRIGRYGWKAQIATIPEFATDGLAQELNMTVPEKYNFITSRIQDEDEIADPEVSENQVEALITYISHIHPPTPKSGTVNQEGKALFDTIGCSNCHITQLEGAKHELYTDLLLHDVQKQSFTLGFRSDTATARQFRTSPLLGVGLTAPYWHDGSAVDLNDAIVAHEAEGAKAKNDYMALTEAQKAALIDFLNAL